MIEFLDVYKAFDVPVLSGITLSVEEGELFGFIDDTVVTQGHVRWQI